MNTDEKEVDREDDTPMALTRMQRLRQQQAALHQRLCGVLEDRLEKPMSMSDGERAESRDVFERAEDEMVTVKTKRCVQCGLEGEVTVPRVGYEMWANGTGPHIQRAMPGVSADVREQLISGTHPACWDKLFGGDD